jgi:hypothetical protein
MTDITYSGEDATEDLRRGGSGESKRRVEVLFLCGEDPRALVVEGVEEADGTGFEEECFDDTALEDEGGFDDGGFEG